MIPCPHRSSPATPPSGQPSRRALLSVVPNAQPAGPLARVADDMPGTVLIVEDEAILAKNIGIYLARHGIEALTAATGFDALALLATQRPDVVLVDFDLPGMDGLDLIERIRRIDARLPVVMLTGHGDADLADRAREAGAREYLTKPIALAEIWRALERAAA